MNASNTEFATIAALDLEPIKVKLMHEKSGEGWSLEEANAVEFEYRRFLFLMKRFPTEEASPRRDVDIFWHYHILDTLKYAKDCEAVFGYFLHHFPYIGLRGADDVAAHRRVGERMQVLYEATFGDPYVRTSTAQQQGVLPLHANDAAFSAALPMSAAFSAANPMSAAFSAAPPMSVAFSAAPPMSAAFSAAPPMSAAFSAALPMATAFSAAPPMTAFSAAMAAIPNAASPAGPHDDSGSARYASLFAERPTLASAAASH